MRRPLTIVAAAFLFALQVARAGIPFDELLKTTTAFAGSLDEHQKSVAIFEFNSDERLNWHYVPYERKGIALKDLSADQQKLAFALLQSVLSQEGFKKIEGIRDLENVLKEMEPNSTNRDPLNYHLTIFGEPSTKGDWGVRYEGHHLSLHWTVVDGKIIATFPQFLGTNPGEVRTGPKKGTRVLGQEEDIGYKLVKSLDEKQRTVGIVSDTAPEDILTKDTREAAIQADTGITFHDLNKEQQGVFLTLIQVYANTMRPEIAEERLQKVRAAGLDSVKFAWMGSIENGQKHYYRVQGPTFLIEFDNTQNDANHVHTVWRDFHGDFGEDVLKEHYRDHADPKHPGVHQH